MLLRLSQIKLPLDYHQDNILKAVAKRLKCSPKAIVNCEITSRALDTRSASQPPFYSASIDCDVNLQNYPKFLKKNECKLIEPQGPTIIPDVLPENCDKKIVIVGAGPAGLMCALILAQSGLKPLLIDRGSSSEKRKEKVDEFWAENKLDEECNVLFGEGGAGLFSDGKLTARSKDNYRMNLFFDFLVSCGADPNIRLDKLPHVGSDKLMEICPKIRQEIIRLGGEIRFDSKLEDLTIDGEKVVAVTVNGESIAVDETVLVIGHSARDTYKMLYDRKIALEAKSFAVGVRVEIPQTQVDKSQLGKWCNLPNLGAASYKLTRRNDDKSRGTYSFCMCPGGTVVSCSSEKEYVTTNGMSYDARDLPFSNAAFLVGVTPEDFPKTEPSVLAGIEYQRQIEKKSFELANYSLAVSTLKDFLSATNNPALPTKRSFENSLATNISKILPKNIYQTLKRNIPLMLKKMRAVKTENVTIYGPETRSSAPVRIVRSEKLSSLSCENLYPAGEGAGYAGGIVSSAIDGIRIAEAIIEKYC